MSNGLNLRHDGTTPHYTTKRHLKKHLERHHAKEMKEKAEKLQEGEKEKKEKLQAAKRKQADQEVGPTKGTQEDQQ